MGEPRAYAHIERILRIQAHTAACLTGENAAMPHRRAEKLLLRRLRSYAERTNIDLQINDCAKTPRSADILVRSKHRTALWDSKDYRRPVPWTQVQKLARDVRIRGAAFGVIVCPRGVAGTNKTSVICDGVPIHICEPKSEQEFACLYLTDVVDHDANTTQICARFEAAKHDAEEINKICTRLKDLLGGAIKAQVASTDNKHVAFLLPHTQK